MKFIFIIYTTNNYFRNGWNIRGVRLREFKFKKNILGVRMHFRHSTRNTRLTQMSKKIDGT